MSDSKDKPITSWPPPEPVRQVTKEELKRMSHEAIDAARKAGALQDIMSGKKPEPPKVPLK